MLPILVRATYEFKQILSSFSILFPHQDSGGAGGVDVPSKIRSPIPYQDGGADREAEESRPSPLDE